MSVTTTIKLSAAISQALALDKGTAAFTPSHVINKTLADGTGADQANQVFSDQRTLAGSANEELDLSGSLVDAFGNTIAFTKIKAIIISAAAANGGDIQVGGSASNGFDSWVGAAGDLVVVQPDGAFVLVAPGVNGYAVTAGTGDLLKITNTDASPVTYDITIIGVE